MVHIEHSCKLIHEMFRLPIFIVDHQGDIAYEFFTDNVQSPFYPSIQELVQQFYYPDAPHQFPIFKITNFQEHFFVIALHIEGAFIGNIVVGPYLLSRLSEENVNGIINDTNTVIKRDEMTHYYKLLTVIPQLKLIQVSMLLHYMIYQKPLDSAEILHENQILEPATVQTENPDLSISNRLANISISSHHKPIHEKRLFSYIKEGRKEQFLKLYHSLPDYGEMGLLSKNSHIRNQKNIGIVAIALATRYAIDGGLHPETAYTLSDLYIQNIEDLNSVKEVQSFIEQSLCDFIDRVKRSKALDVSKPIYVCQNYIFDHVYEEISLSTLAEVVGLNHTYLSVLFKKETGIGLNEYIQSVKIGEAKNLIEFTNYSIKEIYN
ncbi:helix-turn-helix domain-containing protein, partial [Priestia megaterium]